MIQGFCFIRCLFMENMTPLFPKLKEKACGTVAFTSSEVQNCLFCSFVPVFCWRRLFPKKKFDHMVLFESVVKTVYSGLRKVFIQDLKWSSPSFSKFEIHHLSWVMNPCKESSYGEYVLIFTLLLQLCVCCIIYVYPRQRLAEVGDGYFIWNWYSR